MVRITRFEAGPQAGLGPGDSDGASGSHYAMTEAKTEDQMPMFIVCSGIYASR
jgi:hypothetical protein